MLALFVGFGKTEIKSFLRLMKLQSNFKRPRGTTPQNEIPAKSTNFIQDDLLLKITLAIEIFYLISDARYFLLMKASNSLP